MRPLWLTIEGLRSFRKEELIDFTGRDHIAIIGDTGAGKSSILEAMTYALYGRTTFAGRGHQELMNDTSTHMRVVFRFRVSDETWEVVRSVRLRKSGGIGQTSAQLTRIGADESPIEQVEQVRRVNERVEDLLGLDCDAFLRTVILPQGRFARLLVEDEPRERSAILRQVWRTDELEVAGKHAAEAFQGAREVRIRGEAAAARYPDDPEAHLGRLQDSLAGASREAAAAGVDEREADGAHQAMRVAEDEASIAARVRDRLASVDLKAVESGLAPLAERALRFDEHEAELARENERLEAERAAIPEGDGPSSGEVAVALTTLPGLQPLAAAVERAGVDLRASIAVASEKCAEADRRERRAAAATARSDDQAADRPPLEEAVRSARAQLDEVEARYQTCAARAGDLDKARKRLEEIGTEEAGYAEPIRWAKDEEARAKREAAEAEEHLATARRSDSAAHASRELHPGDSCPVCRRELPTGWEAPAGGGLGQAERLASRTLEAAKAAERQVHTLETELRSIQKRASAAGAEVAGTETRFGQAQQELVRLAALEPGARFPERGAVLAPLEAAHRKATAALDEHLEAEEERRAEVARRNSDAQLGRQAARNARETADTSRRTASGRLGDLVAAIRAVPDPFRPDLALAADVMEIHELDVGPITRNTESAKARDRALEKRRQEADRLSAAIRTTEVSRRALAQRRADEVEKPLRGLAQSLRQQRDVLVETASQLELRRPIPHGAGGDPAALAAHLHDLRAGAEGIASVAERRSAESARNMEAARLRLQAVGERLGASVDAPHPDAVLGRARDRAEAARFRERTARNAEEHFAGVATDVRRLLALLDDVRQQERALGDLADALKPGRFLKWLTLRRSKHLLVHASRKLEEVSGGRYSFMDPEDTDEAWRVLDRDSNRPRTPASLSGGEQFLASLSLALGLVEMMARSGGRLEALFLDEGFGSLDVRNLDSAVQALETAASRRMVAVISHVRAVAEQIENVLAVTREVTGSRAVWLSAGERQRMAASDAEGTVLAGLLD